ncbi:hypothetical protein EYF80_042559 [Liparis tanakae]|uniref:Uncharacterized protein n=1 Tax=Liparis tanakae TaxID=230148 RepID=A0A4Z2G1W9_9TELE|nr:hypothetical protein EYF80_042559 [Liparis tanakae]
MLRSLISLHRSPRKLASESASFQSACLVKLTSTPGGRKMRLDQWPLPLVPIPPISGILAQTAPIFKLNLLLDLHN